MSVPRRRLFWSVLLSGGAAAAQAQPTAPDSLRHVAAAVGLKLSDDRLRVIKPILDQRQTQLQALRDFAIDDSVSPRHG